MSDSLDFDDLDLQPQTLRILQETAVKAAGAGTKIDIRSIPGHPLGSLFVTNSDGIREEYHLPVGPRKSALHCVDQVGVYARHAMDNWDVSPAVYYNRSVVTVVLQDGSLERERDFAACELAVTPEWKLLLGFSDAPDQAWKKHTAFVRMLRVDLSECFDGDVLDNLLTQIGQLDFVQGDRIQSVAVRNRESMGREVASEIRAVTGEIPEELWLNVRIYQDATLTKRHRIRCLLETSPTNGTLALIPAAGEMNRILDQELASLGDLLRSNVRPSLKLPTATMFESPNQASSPQIVAEEPWYIPVFYGTP